MADDDFDRPHYHVFASDEYVGAANLVDLDVPCNDDHNSPTAVVVVALDDYRRLVAAACDRHPTNQQRRPDPAGRAFEYTVTVDNRTVTAHDPSHPPTA